ncbi:DisA bacterial checkpoint controller nucleotide-binding protein [Aquisphaera giovannonii]|uniref:DisA bacterial checkpoint controller nucleotide-binding protein n=1 Tax=Aquisphaera giovannonii TaxID=406548 RepID=A0A5B9W536_9BACT|nr:DisA bacterial checkpoint controller nucleotide-binding protein [Aquisphaera giovannonii]
MLAEPWTRSLRLDRGVIAREHALLARTERPSGPISRVVGLYQALLRRTLEHFFPDSVLEVQGDRSVIDLDGCVDEPCYRIRDDGDHLGLDIEWLGTKLTFRPQSPVPLLPTERRMVDTIVRALDMRFRGLFDQDLAGRLERFQYVTEDLIIADFIRPVNPYRIPAALEALRVAALSTYENRRVSTGALLLSTNSDPADPKRANAEGAPRFNARLTAIKGFHRLCDGVNTLFLVDREGEMLRMADIERWSADVQDREAPLAPCPRPYVSHARATQAGGHVCLVLTPSQDIKVFSEGTMLFSLSDARWRLLDIPSKFAAWRDAVGATTPPELALWLFQAALNLGEARTGALFVVVRDRQRALAELIAPIDRMTEEVAVDDPQDPENLSPRLAKRALHHAIRGADLCDMEPAVLESIASLDGAVVVDTEGAVLTFGAILRIAPETLELVRSVQGARTLAALAASEYGPVLKVSQDGYITMFLKGRRLWEL